MSHKKPTPQNQLVSPLDPRRRHFIKSGIKGILATSLIANASNAACIQEGGSDKLGPILPTRPLANTGEALTLLGMGGAHIGRMDEKQAQTMIEYALECGIRFFDNAQIYSKGRAETYYGKFLTPKYRDKVFIMTKTRATNAKQLHKQFDESLQRLNTDYVDLFFIHSFQSVADVNEREAGGVFDAIQELKASGKVRHIGYSCHTNTTAALHFLEKTKSHPFTCCGMTPINPVDAATPDNSFTTEVLPKMVECGQAHFAMKTLSGGSLMGKAMKAGKAKPTDFPIPTKISYEDNLNFVLSQPITSWVSGMETKAHLDQNSSLVRQFRKLSHTDKKRVIQKVARFTNAPLIEQYKRPA